MSAATFNLAAVQLLQRHGARFVDSPFFPGMAASLALELEAHGARGLTDAELAAAVGEPGLAGLGGFFSKIKDAFKKTHVLLMKPLTNSVRVPQDLFNKWGAPDWANRITDLLSEIPAKPWNNKKAVIDVVSGFLSGSWAGLAIAVVALVAQNEVMHHKVKSAQERLAAEAAAFAKMTDAEKAKALAALGASIALRLNVPENDEGRKEAGRFAEACGVLWSQGKSPARAAADVLAAESLKRTGVAVDAPSYLEQHKIVSDAVESQLAAGAAVPDVEIPGVEKSAAASSSIGSWLVAGAGAAAGAAGVLPPSIAAAVVAAPLVVKLFKRAAPPRDIVGPTSSAAPATSTSTPAPRPPVRQGAVSRVARRGLMGIDNQVDAEQLLAAHFEWARIHAPIYYAELARHFDVMRYARGDGLGWAWLANVGTVIQAIGSAAQVYSTVRGAENEKKLVNAQIEQIRALTKAQTQAPVSSQVLPTAAPALSLATLAVPVAIAAGAAVYLSRRRRRSR